MNARDRVYLVGPTPRASSDYEQEARRLRAAYVGDILVRLAVAIDLNVRRVAHRLVAALCLGGTPCR
jgi:hypothetical protein